MNKKIFKKLEKLDFMAIEEGEDYYILYIGNSGGEDFNIEINKSNTKQEIQEIIDFCKCYDVDEHFALWFGANMGEPQSARDLLENCEEIGENLDKLREVLEREV